MTLESFNELLQTQNGIQISKKYNIFNDYELYDFETKREKKYNSLDELVNDNPDVKKIIDEAEDFYLDWEGGRGSSSSNANMGGGFGHAGSNAEMILESLKTIHPAELNLNNAKGTNVEHALDKFIDKYGTAKNEYGALIDKDGYAVEINLGSEHSTGFSTSKASKGSTFIHNHPSGSNFSDTDLKSFANSNLKSVIATSSNDTTKGTYQISKGNHFDAKGFIKGISNAKWDTNKYGYNDGADWWLKKNQKKYGYTYTSKGMKNAGKDAGW